MSGIRRSDPIERRKITLMRQADSETNSAYNIGGVEKKSHRPKPSLPKMPWDEPVSIVPVQPGKE